MERARDGKGYGATVRGRVDGASVAGAKGAAAVKDLSIYVLPVMTLML